MVLRKKLPILLSTLPFFCWADDSFSVSCNEISAQVNVDGTIQLYRTPLGEKPRALLASTFDCEPSFVSVIANGREFRSNAAGIERNVKSEDDKIRMEFSSKGNFSAFVSLEKAKDAKKSVWLAPDSKDFSCLKMDFSLKNDSDFRALFSLRAFFDTILGDNCSVSFESAAGTEFLAENYLSGETLKKECALRSTNDKVFLGFAFDDFPKSICVANRDVLFRELSREEGVRYRIGRSFSSATSYLNSALCICYDDFALESNEECVFTIYLSTGIVNKNEKMVVRYVEPKDEKTTQKNPKKETKKDDKQNVDFTVSNLRDYQLDPAYIQGLVARINSLRSGEEEPADRTELARLNAELDAILEKLQKEQEN